MMSLHLTEHNAIFFHIQKTGGRWVGHTLEKNNIFYITNHEKGTKNGPMEIKNLITDQFLFTFIRHPVAIYKSLFTSKTMSSLRMCFRNREFCEELIKIPGFNEFIFTVLQKRVPYVTQMYNQYINREIKMNFIGHTENLAEDLMQVLDLLGAPYNRELILRLPPTNTSSTSKEPKLTRFLMERAIELEKEIINKYYKNTPYENYIYEFAN